MSGLLISLQIYNTPFWCICQLEKDFFMNLSERLKELRTEKNLTQKQIALKLNVAYQVYQRWEKGERQPKKESIENLANVFNVSVGYLLGETNIKSGSEIDEIMEKLKVPRQQKTIQFAKKQLIEQTEEDKNSSPL